jgi:endonuclease/exonuclease/phosphatase family metal-dependent hydrolase
VSLWPFVVAVATFGVSLSAQPSTFSIAFYNIRSGQGIQPLRGRAPFADTVNCDAARGAVNAWAAGVVQRELQDRIGNDPSMVAFGLAEAWNCAAPRNVREVLGWRADSGERNGVAIVAKHGFMGPVEWLQLDTARNANPRDTMWVVRGPVCLTPDCANHVDVYAAHWAGTGPEGRETLDAQARATVGFMSRSQGPHVLVGDLNVFEGAATVCGQRPNGAPLVHLRGAGYLDAWPELHGGAEGYTGMVNRAGCGEPEGYVWKRIDYAWSKQLKPIEVTRFGMAPVGAAAPSDHFGLLVRYALPSAAPARPQR